MTPQHFYTVPIATPCAIFANCAHHKINSLHALSYMHLMNKVLSIAHYTAFHRPISAMFSSNKISHHNLNSNIPYRPSTAHALHSFSIQARHTIPASSYIVYALHTQHYPPHTAFHNPPLHTTKKHIAYLCKWRQNGTRCRKGHSRT